MSKKDISNLNDDKFDEMIIDNEIERWAREKGHISNPSIHLEEELPEIPLATNHTVFYKPDDRKVTDLTVEELRNILRTEILVNVLPYVNQTKISDINHGFFQTSTDIRTWIDPNKEPHKTWMQHKDEDTD